MKKLFGLLGAVFILLAGALSAFDCMNCPDIDGDIARAILCEKLADIGNLDALKLQIGRIQDKEIRREMNAVYSACIGENSSAYSTSDTYKFWRIKKHSAISEREDFYRLVAEASTISKSGLRARAMLEIARLGKPAVSRREFEVICQNALWVLSESRLPVSDIDKLECCKLLFAMGEPSLLVDFLPVLTLNANSALFIYSTVSNDFVVSEYRKVLKAKNPSMRKIRMRLWYAVYAAEKGATDSFEKIEKSLYYIRADFGFSWRIKNEPAYKYPAIAFLMKKCGNEAAYSKYRNLSLSESQLKDMAGGYENYITYAVSVFAECGDYSAAARLLDTLSPAMRGRVLRRTAMHWDWRKLASAID